MINKELPWTEAIEQVIEDSGGAASLEKMYAGILKYRDVSNNRAWQATLRGILYRDMKQSGRVERVGLGVFGFKSQAASQGTFAKVAAKEPVVTSSRHAATQGMLIELGNFYGYDTYTADANAKFDGKPLSSLASVQSLPPFTGYADLLKQVSKVDVVWLTKGTTRSFPRAALEVENTPEFSRSLSKLYQLRDFNAEFYLIADANKDPLFQTRLNNDPYHAMKERFSFRSFQYVTQLYVAAAQHFLLHNKLAQASGHTSPLLL